MGEIGDIAILAGVAGSIFIAWKAGILDNILGGITGGGGGSTGGGSGGTVGGNAGNDGVTRIYQSQSNPLIQASPDGGGGQVSLHSLQSGGSSWRKQWVFTGPTYTDVEVSGYFYIPGGNDTISCKLRGNGHSGSGDNATTRKGCCYDFQLPFPSGTSNTNFSKECPHPDYDKVRLKTEFDIGKTTGRWIGQKAIAINSGNTVICEQWLDVGGLVNNKPANQWKRWYRIIDNGNISGMSGPRKPPFLRPAGNSVIWRIDGTSKAQVSGYQARFLSARAITGSRAASSSFTQQIIPEIPWSPLAQGQMLIANQMRARTRRY